MYIVYVILGCALGLFGGLSTRQLLLPALDEREEMREEMYAHPMCVLHYGLYTVFQKKVHPFAFRNS